MAKTKKVYDYNTAKVKNKLVTTFKKRKNESTIADLIAATGLPKYQVEQTVKTVLDEYSGHLKVSESGEILYYFPRGMHSRIKGFGPSLKKFFSAFFRITGKVLAFLFKIWIMVMLVGYFVLFLAILIASIALAIFGAASSKGGRSSSRSRGRGGGILFLVLRLIEFFLRIFFWVSITKTSREKKKRGRPLYKEIFGYVFGDIDPNQGWEEKEKRQVIAFIRAHRGIITVEELMVLTGRDPEQARQLMNRYLLEFEGEPMVTEQGTIIYFFPELLRSRMQTLEQAEVSLQSPLWKSITPFSNNKTGKNVAISFFNAFNLFFGSYFFLFASAGLSAETAEGFGFIFYYLYVLVTQIIGINMGQDQFSQIVLIALGIIPLSFSLFFFMIPIIRKIRLNKHNEEIRKENLRKKIYSYVLSNPSQVDAKQIVPTGVNDAPKKSKRFIEKQLNHLAGEKHAEVEARDDGSTYFRFPELERELADVTQYRQTIDLSKYEVGDTVFDSGEDVE